MRKEITLLVAILLFGISNINAQTSETFFTNNKTAEFEYEAGAMDIGAKGTAKVKSISGSIIVLDITSYMMGPDYFQKKNPKQSQMELEFKNGEYIRKGKLPTKGQVYNNTLSLNIDDGEYSSWIHIKLKENKTTEKVKNNNVLTVKYDAKLGSGTIYYQGKVVKVHNNWRKSWHSVVRISCNTKNKFLFYDKNAGQGEIYNIDTQGNMTLVKAYSGFSKNWSKISWENNGDCNGLIKFEQADGYWEKYTCDNAGNINLQSKKQ